MICRELHQKDLILKSERHAIKSMILDRPSKVIDAVDVYLRTQSIIQFREKVRGELGLPR